MSRKPSTKPLDGFTAEESELIRAYRRAKMQEYWSNKTPEERRAIHKKSELNAAKRFAEQQAAKEKEAETSATE